MNTARIKYLVLIFVIISLGILSRKINCVPLFIGDILYAALIYFGFRFLFINQKKSFTAFTSILICFLIEISQLVNWNWLNIIRHTELVHYALGEGFLWIDFVAYTFGVTISFIVDTKMLLYSSRIN